MYKREFYRGGSCTDGEYKNFTVGRQEFPGFGADFGAQLRGAIVANITLGKRFKGGCNGCGSP